ncbi:MAG: hypothetical protein HY602_00625, partial [Parcubacteria group bacterium]|nr:hypothetical protein [Parcubacteria group bacterium]
MSFFEHAHRCCLNSTCLKTQTGAVIVKDGRIISRGWNLCAPEGVCHGEKVCECPRMKVKTGTGYELCRPVHAEVMACLNIRPDRKQGELALFASHLKPAAEEILSAFTDAEKTLLSGSVLYLAGHYWACEACRRFATLLGVEILVDPLSVDKIEDRYRKEGII